VEAFFVVVLAGVFLGVGAWALLAIRRVLATTDRRSGDE
jgi:hypothetical protein